MTKPKVLVPTTIIPPDLYVTRAADRQLRAVIDNMGRPAYALVSRQMGKTNLLIHAKREAEGDDCSFAYVDLSNRPGNSFECFRRIADAILANERLNLRTLRAKLLNSRISQIRSPFQEHQDELLAILEVYQGKLVVVLDEIDALADADYADELFAQIRSVYFARINYRDFERLTYVLSGVAEPSSLIKDKNKSPFNIGEKIYLEDFSEAEHAEFVSRLGLEFSDDVIARAFYWTNGHPRMSWDVWSELEDLTITGQEIGCQLVDEAVRKLYFSDSPQPPVDHIRDLVRKDSVVLGTIRDLNAGKHPVVPDEIRSRLFLSGATAFDLGGNTPRLKNNVLREALSGKWIESVGHHKVSLLRQGNDSKQLGDFKNAIRFFKEALTYITDTRDSLADAIQLEIAECFVSMREIDNALLHINLCRFDAQRNTPEYYKTLFVKGVCYYSLDDHQSALSNFKAVIDEHRVSVLRCRALLNYAASLLAISDEDRLDDVAAVYDELLEQMSRVVFDNLDEANYIQCLAHYNLACLSLARKNQAEAVFCFEQALRCEVTQLMPSILLEMADIQTEGDKRNTIERAINLLMSGKLSFRSGRHADLLGGSRLNPFDKDVLLGLLVEVFKKPIRNDLDQILEFVRERYFPEYVSDVPLLTTLAGLANSLNLRQTSTTILERLVFLARQESEVNSELIRTAVRNIGVYKFNATQPCYENLFEFFQRTESLIPDLHVSSVDAAAYAVLLAECRRSGKVREGLEVARSKTSWLRHADGSGRHFFFGVHYLHALLADTSNDTKEATSAAREALKFANEHTHQELTMFGGSRHIQNMEREMLSIIRRRIKPSSLNSCCPCGSGRKFKRCCEPYLRDDFKKAMLAGTIFNLGSLE